VALARLEFEQIVGFLGEARQHQAQLVVRRPANARLLQFVLDPALMDAPSVDRTFLLQPDIGYVRVTSFDPKTATELKAAIDSLGGGKLKGLVLDLRDNGGGVVQAALQAASYFLKPGQRLLSVKGRSIKGQDVDAPTDSAVYQFPLAVLVNEKTASASEILAGALQDHDRATIIGEPSFGKGLVQNVFPLSGNTAMALTTAFYYTPSGRSIQKPITAGQLEVEKQKEEFHTDSGRSVTGGGGIRPDVHVEPEPVTRLRMALDASGTFTSYATSYMQKQKVSGNFEVSASDLEDFQVYAAERGIQPAVGEWLKERAWVQSRLKQEIFNQALGVAKGDEVEAHRDPVVEAALQKLAP
jgi:carboxyl-terminal processing protease